MSSAEKTQPKQHTPWSAGAQQGSDRDYGAGIAVASGALGAATALVGAALGSLPIVVAAAILLAGWAFLTAANNRGK